MRTFCENIDVQQNSFEKEIQIYFLFGSLIAFFYFSLFLTPSVKKCHLEAKELQKD